MPFLLGDMALVHALPTKMPKIRNHASDKTHVWITNEFWLSLWWNHRLKCWFYSWGKLHCLAFPFLSLKLLSCHILLTFSFKRMHAVRFLESLLQCISSIQQSVHIRPASFVIDWLICNCYLVTWFVSWLQPLGFNYIVDLCYYVLQ